MNRDWLLTSALILPLSGCISAKDVGDSLADTDAHDQTESGSDDPSMGETDGPNLPLACELNPDYSCTSAPPPCEDDWCGGPLSGFDADGCPRISCGGDRSCPGGYTCVTLGDWGACGASSTFCEEFEGECACGGTLDCSPFVSYCVEDEIAPPAVCHTFTDETSCLEAGCSTFFLAPRIDWSSESPDACSCGELVPTCLWFADGEPGGDSARHPYVRLDDDEADDMRLFHTIFDVPPLGWHPCSDVMWHPACACAQGLDCE
jgi:hypothetical protein